MIRLFSPDRVARHVAKVAKAVADTQAGVERYYYELRKKLFEFDEVLASQREDTYATRATMVYADLAKAQGLLADMAASVVQDIVGANWPKAGEEPKPDLPSILEGKLRQFFPPIELTAAQLGGSREEVERAATAAAEAAVASKVERLESVRKGLGVESIRFLTLTQMDNLWKAHMKSMGFVKDFAGLKAYAQLNPLDVYREEGLKLYASMQTQ